MEENIFKGLNMAQEEAVRCIDGPSLIIAGAGSGKTKVLTCRIANLLEHGCLPQEVLALTFTRKAAGEMKERIGQMVGEKNARRIVMGTFHSVFIRFLREFAELLGFPEGFTIYDQSDSRSAVRQVIKELELDDKVYKPNDIANRISLAKNNLVTYQLYKSNASLVQNDMQTKRGRICDIYERYAQRCKAAGAMDFDDILLYTNILFRDFPDALSSIRSRFRYILVDEYQDTNVSQYRILKNLAAAHQNICVVGDDSQSIYGFRGAKIENILNFRKDYPQAQLFRLEQNYRSTRNIVDAANSLIAKNDNRIPKECFSEAATGERLGLLTALTEQEEGFMIASSIVDRIYRDKAEYEDFVVLYRTNAQSRAIEEALRKRNLPYRIYAGHSFFDRAEVKDLLAYFRLVVNNKDDEAFRRVINVPARGIGDTSLSRLSEAALAHDCSLFEAACLSVNDLAAAGLRGATADKFHAFVNLIAESSMKASTADAYDLAVEIANRSGYYMSLKSDSSFEGQAKLENVEELLNSVKEYSEDEEEMRENERETDEEEIGVVTLCDYLENVALLSEIEKEDEADGETANRITLMTIHSSKGLEFPYVYIAGMEENLFPSAAATEAEIEEERRLCYVAITRAMRVVTMSHSRSRMKWGEHQNNAPSRFLREIDPKYFDADVRALFGRLRTGDDDDWSDRPSGGFGRGRQGYERQKPDYRQYVTTPQRPQTPKTGGYSRPQYGPSSRPSPAPSPAPVHAPVAPQRPAFSPRPAPAANFIPSSLSELAVGKRVEHDRFGEGTIISMEGSGVNQKAIVDFLVGGKKTLLLKYAKLRVLA